MPVFRPRHVTCLHQSQPAGRPRRDRPVRFTAVARDRASAARLGRLDTPHGAVETPAFMPVGTQATVKGLTPDQLRATGTRMLLANTYHLALRPGDETVAALGGLHRSWAGTARS